MRSKSWKQALSFILAFLLTFELIPAWVFAEDESSETDEVSTEEESTAESVPDEQADDPEDQASSDEDTGYEEKAYADDDIIVEEFARNVATSEKEEIVEEIASRRDEFQKEFIMANGMNLITIYPVSVHYDKDGEWEEIDNTLVPIASDGEEGKESYRNTSGIWDVMLPAEIDSSKEVVLNHDGYEMRFWFLGEIAVKGEDASEEETGDTESEDQEGNDPEAPDDGDTAEPGDDTSDDTVTGDTEDEDNASDEGVVLSEDDNTDATFEPLTDTDTDVDPEEEPDNDSEGYELRPLNTAAGIVEERRDAEEISASREILNKINSSIRYDGVLKNTDLTYSLISHQLKETVTINEYREDLVGYCYQIDAENLVLKVEDNKEIRAYPADTEGDPLFYLPASFLYDSEHEFTDEIDIKLEETEGGYYLTYLLPKDWLSDSERVYPVTLDPVVQPVYNQDNIRDRTVASNYTFNYASPYIEAGKIPGSRGIERIYMMFNDIPTLTSADVVVSASISMYKDAGNTGQTVEVHKVEGTWDSSSITWSNKPDHKTLVEDFVIPGASGGYTWDITNIAQGWYETGVNTGMMFKLPDSVENGSNQRYCEFLSSDYSAAGAPVLQIAYVNNTGLEGIWDYTSQSAGRAGTGHVNLYTGNLVWEHESLGFTGNKLPVAIKLIYNANDKSNNTFGAGYGWRTNFNQLVYQWSQDSSYYVWEDGDGTRHYFKYKSSGVYESELDSKTTLTTTGGGGTVYCISTEGSTIKSYFDSSGRLTQITNYQQTAHSITVTYAGTSKLILTVTDGAGRKYAYSYNGQSIQGIYYYGTQSTTVERMYYTQTNNELTGVRYQDNKTTSFSYTSNHLLNGAYDVNGAKVLYTYNQLGNTAPNRVIYISEYGVGNVGSGSLAFTYTQGQTKMADNLGHTRTLQFNNWGSTTCVQNDLGQAVASRYVNSTSGASDNRKTGSQTALSSKLQNTVMNLVLNGGFEKGTDYWVASSSSNTYGTRSVSTSVSYMGEKSLVLTHGSSQDHVIPGHYHIQNQSTVWHYAEPGETYTLSAYVLVTHNMSGTGGAYISMGTSETDFLTNKSESVTTASDEWKKLEVTFTYPEEVSDNRLMVFLNLDSFGTAYFDCVQLEKSATASRFNLIENGDFDFPRSTADPYYWTRGHSSASTTEKRITLSGTESPAPCLDSEVFLMTGSATAAKTYHQTLLLSGEEGDVYTLAGWAKADSVPLRDNRSYTIIARFNNTDGTTTDAPCVFTTAVGRTGDWQYASCRAVAKKAYNSITILLCYSYNSNTVYFDGIQFFKEEYGKSFTYDSDGNVISVKDLHEQTTTYQYTNNDLTKIILPDGTWSEYEYDNYHNVTYAKSPEGVYASFAYDTYGNNTSVQVGSNPKFKATATYTSNGNQMATLSNTAGNTTSYTYYDQTELLYKLTEPGGGAVTTYSYDSIHRLTQASLAANSLTTDVTYLYDEGNCSITGIDDLTDLLSRITTPSGTEYSFKYNEFYQPAVITVGSGSSYRTLISNSYDQTTHYLTGTTYGNGDSVGFTYDDFGRVKTTQYGTNDSITYAYNSEGNLGYVTYGDRKTRYYYDFQGELRGVDIKDGTDSSSVRWTYDEKDNLTKMVENYNGTEYETEYTYNSDDKLTRAVQGSIGSAVTYNDFGQLSEVKNGAYSSLNGDISSKAKTRIIYETYDSESRWSSRVKNWSQIRVQTKYVEYEYSYDQRDNITSITDITDPNDQTTTNYVYDNRNRLVREDNPEANLTWTYSYDNGGNITSKQEYPFTTGTLGTPGSTVTYSYNVDDQNGWKDLLTSYNGNTLNYDGMGNLLSDGTWDYTWEHGRELAGMSDAGNSGNVITFGYDADGLRISKTVDSAKTKYYYAGGKLTHMTLPDETDLHFVYDVIGPAAVIYDGSTYYYLRNAQGDVIGLVNSHGNRVVSYSYDAWGRLLSTTGSEAAGIGEDNPLRYRGYIYDTETGLYYLKSRYYNPEWGRFINADSPAVPTISPESATLNKNLYSYCDNNPVNKTDSEGTFACAIVGAITGGLVEGFFSYMDGKGFGAGFVSGALSGFVAGAGVDIATLSIANPIAGGALSFALGAIGSVAGDLLYAHQTKIPINWTKTLLDAGFCGLLNVASFGITKECARGLTQKPLLKNILFPSITDIPGAQVSTAFGFVDEAFEIVYDQITENGGSGKSGGGGVWTMMYM